MGKEPTQRKESPQRKEPPQHTARPKKDPAEKIVDAAMKLAGERGWRQISLADIAAEAKLPFAEIYRHCPSKLAILDALARQTDAAVLTGLTGESDEDPHDRLFDILMRRLDALGPYKDGVRAVLRDAPRDPMSILCSGPQLIRSFSWMLVASGISDRGLRGLARTKTLILVWLTTMRVWLRDEDPDLGRTMAALDRNLKRAERWCGLIGGRPRTPSEPSEAAA